MRNGEIQSVGVVQPSGTGSTYTFSNSVGEVALIQADILADNNGVVHIIDNVLKPSFFYRSVIDLTGGTYYPPCKILVFLAGLSEYSAKAGFHVIRPERRQPS
jgi:hypothetical protein